MDASVKIYSHRVDDTHASSHRILESLSRNGTGNNEDEDDDDDTNGKTVAKVGSKSSSNRLNIAETIERNVSNINTTIERTKAVDPMFHKMSKLFDEGGAKGMLMANMRVLPTQCSLLFDCNRLTADIIDTSPSGDEAAGSQVIDVSDLIFKSGFTTSDLCNESVCPTLDSFRESLGIKDSSAGNFDNTMFSDYFPTSSFALAPSSSWSSSHQPIAASASSSTLLQQADNIDYDDDYDDYQGDGNVGDFEFSSEQQQLGTPCKSSTTPNRKSATPGGTGRRSSIGAKIHWDTVFNQDVATDTVVRDTENIAVSTEATATYIYDEAVIAGNDYTFYDMDKMAKNNSWAGARHWKFAAKAVAKMNRTLAVITHEVDETVSQITAAPTVAVAKEKIRIDFSSTFLADSVFARHKKTSGSDPTVMTAAAIEKSIAASQESSMLLPHDAKVLPKDLSRLFLCPSMILPPAMLKHMLLADKKNWRSRRFMGIPSSSSVNQADCLWGETKHKSATCNGILTTVAIESTFTNIHDNNDDNDDDRYNGGDDYYDDGGDESNANEPTAAVEQHTLDINSAGFVRATRQVEKVSIGYATIAKQVNVRKLKSDIWSHIDNTIVNTYDDENVKPIQKKGDKNKINYTEDISSKESISAVSKDVIPPTAETLSFQDLISDIASQQRQKEVTLPFYFICLLHLANEKTLKIDGSLNMDDLIISKDI